MAKRPYEISLWTYNDRFLSVLVSSDTPKLGQGYEPHWYDGVNGEKKLTFTIPIKFYSTETKSFVNNELWYNNLKQTHSLANEKKVKLIFNKLERANNQYIHEIHEFVIENLTEERTDLDLLCRVECVGAAFKELGKTGTELTLNADTVFLEEEKNNITITPTANYWLDKVFPEPPADSNRIFWRYDINIDNTFNMPSNKIYEKDFITDWEVVNNALNPIYAATPIEKARFIDVSNSNRYNITQDVAEAFQVFVTYKYIYGDDTQPFKITDKVVLFYENALEPTEYSITYGNNELGLTRTSNSADVTTKMFVDKIESDSADDGFVSISKAQNNKHKDDFILNFDYFIKSGQLSSVQTNAIPIFERDLRQANIALGQKTEELVALDSRINILEADVSNLRNKYNAANDNVINIEDKITGLNTELSTYIVDDKDVLNNAKTENGQTFCNLRRQGVLASEFSIRRSDGTLLPQSENYSFIYDRYGYVIRVLFTTASEVVDRTLLRFTYKYDLLSFYRNERATYITIRDSVESSLETKETQLAQAKTAKEQVEADVETLSNNKQTLIDNFNALMTPFLKEGTWNDSDYSPSFQTQTLATIPLTHDPFPLIGEPESSYMVETTKTYYDYIIPPSGISADQIERLIVMDSFTENTIAIQRELRYGAQYTPQFIYDKVVDTTQYDTVESLTSASPSGTQAYFVKETGKVYFNSGTGWAIINPTLVFVLDKDIKLSQAGHTYAVHTNTPTGNTIISIPSGNLKSNTPFTIAQRRWFLTENGRTNGAPYENFQTNSLILKRSELKLEEFEDYNVTHDGALKSITLKINNKVLYNATQFSAEFKLDVSSEQLYRDALTVSETSAFPEVSYDVSFVYLNQALNMDLEDDLNKGKTLKLGNIVRITDYDMQIKGLKGIVTAIDMNLDKPEETSFTIQNYKTRFEDLFARIVASSEQMKTSGYLYDRVAGAFNPNMTLSESILQQTLDSAQFTISSGMANGVSFGSHGILTETAEPYPNGVKGQTWITGGTILLSNSIGADGTRQWTTALSPQGISASVIQTGRLDTGLVNIYSGDQLRFSWKADGMFAYKSENGVTLYDTFVRYNEDGLLFMERGSRAVELGWEGLYIGSQNGSVELTGKDGLEIYNGENPRQLLIKLGGFGSPNYEGQYPDYGMKFYKTINGQHIETLVSTNSGELWLRDTLMVGVEGSNNFVGITGADIMTEDYDPVRIWAGQEIPTAAPFYVTHSGQLRQTMASISGSIFANAGYIGNWIINSADVNRGALTDQNGWVGLSSSGVTYWSGGIRPPQSYYDGLQYGPGIVVTYNGKMYRNIAESIDISPLDPNHWELVEGQLATFYVDANGHLTAMDADIKGRITATSGSFSGEIYAAGGTIGGWQIGDIALTNLGETVGLSSSLNEELQTFWAGGLQSEKPVFYVLPSGHLYAQDAEIAGAIYASRGYFSGTMAIGAGDPWSAEATYSIKDKVVYNGYTYEAIENSSNILPTDTTKWRSQDPYSYISGNTDSSYSLKIGENFTVTPDGLLDAVDGIFSGTVTASAGRIGGWILSVLQWNSIYSYKIGDLASFNDVVYRALQNNTNISPPDEDYWEVAETYGTDTLLSVSGTVGLSSSGERTIWVRPTGSSDDVFYLTPAGELYAEQATIKGNIQAQTGHIIGRLGIGETDTYSYISGKIEQDYPFALKIGDFFSVTHQGTLSAINGEFAGTITANIGYIGGSSGWTIGPELLYSNNYDTGLYAGTAEYKIVEDGGQAIPVRIWAGEYNFDAPIETPFLVDNRGTLYANKANVRGAIIAESGYIRNTFMVGDRDGGIVLQVLRDDDDNFLSSYIGSASFASGAVGHGWKINHDGSATFDNVNVRGTIRSSVFEYNRISAVGGSLYVAPTIYCLKESTSVEEEVDGESNPTDFLLVTIPNDSGSTTIGGREWLVGDTVIYEFSTTIDGAPQEFTNRRGDILSINEEEIVLKISKAEFRSDLVEKLIGNTIYPGALIVFYGKANNRQAIYLTALATEGGPFIDIVDNNLVLPGEQTPEPKVRLGRLDGVNDPYFPKIELEGYGLYSQNAYLRGQLMLPGAGITNQISEKFSYDDGLDRPAIDIEAIREQNQELLNSPIRIWAGLPEYTESIRDARFIVTENGFVYANAGIFSGVINATDGIFSGVLQAAGIVIDKDTSDPFPYDPNWVKALIHPNLNHFYVAYKKNPQTMDDYVLDIGRAGLSIWEGGLRAYSDWEGGWRIEDNESPSQAALLPYGYDETANPDPFPYFSLVDGEKSRVSQRYLHLVEIVRVNSQSHSYYSISNEMGKFLFKKGANAQMNNPKYEALEQHIYNQPYAHSVGISTDIDALVINASGDGLLLNPPNETSSTPVFVGVSSQDAIHGNTPKTTLNVLGTLSVFDNATGGKGAISLGAAQIQEALDAFNVSIGINIII